LNKEGRFALMRNMLEITEKAQEMLNQYISQGDDSDVAVRIEIVGRGANGFNYDLQLVPLKDAKEVI